MEKAGPVNYSLRLRDFLGVMGMALPFVGMALILIFGRGSNPPGVMTSISATYYSNAFVPFIVIVGGSCLFFLFYKDYDVKDWVVLRIAAAGGFTLILFPCALEGARTWNAFMLPQHITNYFHLAGALVFFGCLAYIIGFQFTKTGEGAAVQPGSQKWKRNVLYRVCAAVMVISLVIGFGGARLFGFPYLVFIGETIALEAHGIAWRTKGGVWFRDL